MRKWRAMLTLQEHSEPIEPDFAKDLIEDYLKESAEKAGLRVERIEVVEVSQ